MNKSLRAIFHQDLENIASDLISLYRLQFEKKVSHLSSPLLRWLDFRLRYIDPQPRKIVASEVFPKKFPDSVEEGFLKIQRLMSSGGDLNPFQSKAILHFHDISGKRKSKRTDLLWADWGIHHLHITDIPLGDGSLFSSRACSDGESWILFCIVQHETIALIDVRKHNDEGVFSDENLIRIVKNSWPDYMEQFRLRGMISTAESISSSDLAKLRASGITPSIIIDGEAYISPGLGITTASTSTKVSHIARELRHWVENLADIASAAEGQIQRDISEHAVLSPQIHFCYMTEGLAIIEATRNVGYMLANRNSDATHSRRMHDLLLPSWVTSKLKAMPPVDGQ